MNQDPFADSDESDQFDYEEDSGNVSDTLRNERQPLGPAKSYIPNWRPPHAIREYHQNWKDGIKEANRLANREFKITNKGFNSKDVYTIEARHPDTNKLLGFISWDNGTIQYSNFEAQLNRRSLKLGVSTKREDDNLAGTHGEGFKLASLVMVRRGHHVRYEASSFYWNFGFGGRDKDALYCRLTAIAEKKLKKSMDAFNAKVKRGTPRELKGNIWEDVTVRIGVVHGKGRRVEKAEFLLWIKVSLDLDSPSNLITTPHGSLILDERFQGRIYLKSLFLEAKPAKPFKFCYNFYSGEVDRDRQRLCNSEEEAEILAKIWAEAIKLEDGSALLHLIDMLQDDEQWADVNFAPEYISEETARTVWKSLQDKNVEGQRFYYFDQDGNKDIELIVKSLRKEAAPLKQATWLSLRKFGLIRTPEEQRHHLLQNAPATSLTRTPYSEDIERALRAVLALDSRTRELRLDFRSGGKAELDLLLEGSDLLINDKWLDFDSSHKESSCSTFLEAKAAKIEIDRFSCSHIVKHLYDLILLELSKGYNVQHDDSPHSDDYLRQMVSERLDQMPCMVHVEKGDVGGVLIVKWVHAESDKLSRIHSLELMGWITMHKESTCGDKKLELLTSNLLPHRLSSPQEDVTAHLYPQTQELGACDCSEQLVSLRTSEATFYNLSHEEEYFPMVARPDPQAFFARPPKPLRPNAPVAHLPKRSSRTITPISSVPAVKADERMDRSAPTAGGAFDDFDVVSDDGIGMGIDASPEHLQPSSQSVPRSEITTVRKPESSRYGHNSSPREATIQVGNNGVVLNPQYQSLANDLKKLTAEFETQKILIRAKDQRLQGLEAEITKLSGQLSVERPKTKHLEEEIKLLREILTAKQRDLTEMKSQFTAQTQNLEAKIAALETNEHRRDQATAEIERLHALVGMLEDALYANEQGFENSTNELNRLQTVVDALNKELRRKDADLQEAQSSASVIPDGEQPTMAKLERLRQHNRDLKQQKKDLQSDLEQAQEEVRKALEIAASAASRSLKRSRVKDEIKDEKDDSPRLSDSAWKRARHENVLVANSNAQAVIALD